MRRSVTYYVASAPLLIRTLLDESVRNIFVLMKTKGKWKVAGPQGKIRESNMIRVLFIFASLSMSACLSVSARARLQLF